MNLELSTKAEVKSLLPPTSIDDITESTTVASTKLDFKKLKLPQDIYFSEMLQVRSKDREKVNKESDAPGAPKYDDTSVNSTARGDYSYDDTSVNSSPTLIEKN